MENEEENTHIKVIYRTSLQHIKRANNVKLVSLSTDKVDQILYNLLNDLLKIAPFHATKRKRKMITPEDLDRALEDYCRLKAFETIEELEGRVKEEVKEYFKKLKEELKQKEGIA